MGERRRVVDYGRHVPGHIGARDEHAAADVDVHGRSVTPAQAVVEQSGRPDDRPVQVAVAQLVLRDRQTDVVAVEELLGDGCEDVPRDRPVGLLYLTLTDRWPWQTLVLIVTNDLIWWVPFAAYLRAAWPLYRRTWKADATSLPS
nr:hypothetical protein [Couchioplanes caeruleus]